MWGNNLKRGENIVDYSTVKKEINKEWVKQKFFMMGETKTGKSEFWAQGDKTYFFKLEYHRFNHLSVVGDDIKTMSDFINIINALTKDKKEKGKLPFDTIVIDTADRLQYLMVQYVLEKLNAIAKEKHNESKDGKYVYKTDLMAFGSWNQNGWGKLQDLLYNILDRLFALDCAVVFIAHKKLKVKLDENGKLIEKIEDADLYPSLTSIIERNFDHIINIVSSPFGNATKQVLYTLPTIGKKCGSSLPTIPHQLEWELKEVELEGGSKRKINNAKLNYDKFRKLFD